MPTPSTTTDRLSTATTLLTVATNLLGMGACLSYSPESRNAFMIASAVTGAGLLLSFGWLMISRQPASRFRWAAAALAPLLLIWLVILVPIQKIRNGIGYARVQTRNNAMLTGLAAASYGDTFKAIPGDIRNGADEPLLSWRVRLLPFVDHNPLYKEFDLKQPWDGPHNKTLLEKNPPVYMRFHSDDRQKTPWQTFVGPGTAFDPAHPPLNLAKDFPDGVGNTILFAESSQLVLWSKPADIPYGPNLPLPALGRDYVNEASWPFRGYVNNPGFHVGMADGSVRFLSSNISEATLRALIVRNDGRALKE